MKFQLFNFFCAMFQYVFCMNLYDISYSVVRQKQCVGLGWCDSSPTYGKKFSRINCNKELLNKLLLTTDLLITNMRRSSPKRPNHFKKKFWKFWNQSYKFIQITYSNNAQKKNEKIEISLLGGLGWQQLFSNRISRWMVTVIIF